MKMHGISLVFRVDRRESLLHMFPGLQVRDAIIVPPGQDTHPLTRGEAGCFLSHREAIIAIANDPGSEPQMVVEDDCGPFQWSTVYTLLRHLPQDADVLSLGCNNTAMHFRQVAPGIVDPAGADLYGTHCLIYTSQGARNLKEKLLDLRNPTVPFDLWLSRNSRMYIAHPALAFPRNIGDSETQKIR